MTSKSKRREAEVAAEWYAHEVMGCTITRRAIRTQWQKVDFFGCDIVGKTSDGHHIYLQVTAGGSSCVSVRRKKLEEIPWHITDKVKVLQLVGARQGRVMAWWFTVYEYYWAGYGRKWTKSSGQIAVPKTWFKKCGYKLL